MEKKELEFPQTLEGHAKEDLSRVVWLLALLASFPSLDKQKQVEIEKRSSSLCKDIGIVSLPLEPSAGLDGVTMECNRIWEKIHSDAAHLFQRVTNEFLQNQASTSTSNFQFERGDTVADKTPTSVDGFVSEEDEDNGEDVTRGENVQEGDTEADTRDIDQNHGRSGVGDHIAPEPQPIQPQPIQPQPQPIQPQPIQPQPQPIQPQPIQPPEPQPIQPQPQPIQPQPRRARLPPRTCALNKNYSGSSSSVQKRKRRKVSNVAQSSQGSPRASDLAQGSQQAEGSHRASDIAQDGSQQAEGSHRASDIAQDGSQQTEGGSQRASDIGQGSQQTEGGSQRASDIGQVAQQTEGSQRASDIAQDIGQVSQQTEGSQRASDTAQTSQQTEGSQRAHSSSEQAEPSNPAQPSQPNEEWNMNEKAIPEGWNLYLSQEESSNPPAYDMAQREKGGPIWVKKR